MSALRLSVIQFTPVFGKTAENLARIRALTVGLQTDIIVLPELCTTGYFFLSRAEVAQVAEPAGGATVQFFRELAARLRAVVVAGFAESDKDKLYNSCLLVTPERQEPWVYRKTHLFYKEQHCFDAGDTGFFIVDDAQRNIRIGPMICYDWRFPESARILTLLGADLIVCPANLITDAWKAVMPARAIENKVYLAVANRAGIEKRGDEELHFKGCSVVYDFNGQELQRAETGDTEILNVRIDPVKTRDKSFNQINDVLKDRQPQHYHQLIRTPPAK
jgi:predicted amidohydrolase